MSNTLTRFYITRLPELTPKYKNLQLSIDWWKKCYSESGLLADDAWQLYDEAIERGDRAVVNEVYEQAKMLEDISLGAWGQWQDAKRDLLALSN